MMTGFQLTEEVLILSVARAEKHELDVILIEEVVDGSRDEVDALVGYESAYHGDHGDIVLDGEIQALLESALALCLSRYIILGIVLIIFLIKIYALYR